MGGEEEDPIEPLDMSWPDTWRKRITYLLVLPLILPLWLTLPDTRQGLLYRWTEHSDDFF